MKLNKHWSDSKKNIALSIFGNFKAKAPRGAYIFARIISSYIHIGSISLCCCPVWTILIYYDWQRLDLILPIWKQRFCSLHGSDTRWLFQRNMLPWELWPYSWYMQLDRLIHCWSFSCVPWVFKVPKWILFHLIGYWRFVPYSSLSDSEIPKLLGQLVFLAFNLALDVASDSPLENP